MLIPPILIQIKCYGVIFENHNFIFRPLLQYFCNTVLKCYHTNTTLNIYFKIENTNVDKYLLTCVSSFVKTESNANIFGAATIGPRSCVVPTVDVGDVDDDCWEFGNVVDSLRMTCRFFLSIDKYFEVDSSN